MIRRFLLASGAALFVSTTPVPAMAQQEGDAEIAIDGDEMMGEMFGALGQMLKAEPLTAEQEERLPLAKTIVGKMIPEGSMSEMMDKMMGGSLGSIMKLAGEAVPKQKLAEKLGTNAFALDMSDNDAAELLSVFDPQWKERQKREADMMPKIMGDILSVMEPPMRKAISELYAINFSTKELSEIDAFFSTETGTNFARKSFTMASDPRVMAASMEALPQMMGSFAKIETMMAQATADLPKPRNFSQLTADEKAFVTEASGLSAEEIEQSGVDIWGPAEEPASE